MENLFIIYLRKNMFEVIVPYLISLLVSLMTGIIYYGGYWGRTYDGWWIGIILMVVMFLTISRLLNGDD